MIATEPPAPARIPALDRRSLLKGGVLGAGLLSAPLVAQSRARGFTHGIASGEPGAESVLLWTRYVADQPTQIRWIVTEADANRRVVAEGQALASPDRDWCVKATADGLEPGRWYYYRFEDAGGTASDTGRTRTLPSGPTDRFRMAVFSCSNMGFGWFNAYAHAAADNAFDLAVHTGDYFYEYAPGNYPEDPVGGRSILPDHETVALADYRQRHASYRADPDLQRLTQLMPMVMGWDDHESANDSWVGGAENHQPETEGPWDVRKAAAIRAYREWLPVSEDPWAAYEVGDLATMFRLETRLSARSRPPSLQALIAGKQNPQDIGEALQAYRNGDYMDPARTMLGQAQEDWLAAGLKRSVGSGKPWQVLSQQVLMGTLSTPVALIDSLTDEVPDYVRQRLQVSALASRAGLPLNMDAWDGYPAARARVFEAALAADANLVVLAGDTHNAWAFDLDHAGQRVGVEFGGQSVTSPGFENYLGSVSPAQLARSIVDGNDQLVFADTSQRGYMAVELTPSAATSEYRFLGGVRQRSTALAGTKRLSVRAGERRLDA